MEELKWKILRKRYKEAMEFHFLIHTGPSGKDSSLCELAQEALNKAGKELYMFEEECLTDKKE